MRVLDKLVEYRDACAAMRSTSKELGLVPTMGALHRGHASLMRRAAADGCSVVTTIFVNPTQFGPNEDFEKYPRTLEQDLQICQAEGAEIVFAPPVSEMYPPGERTRVTVSRLTDGLCGASRPGHFDGVTTIVTKLFAATGPCRAYFGRKDYQQYRVIDRMTRDLLLPVRVLGCTTIRESDGLALSSRNRYLSASERVRALGIAQGLALAEQAFVAGERRPEAIAQVARDALARAALREIYVALREPDDLEPLEEVPNLPARALLAVAAYCGTTRLIDNLVLGEESLRNAVEGV